VRHQTVLVSLLISPKTQLDFQKRSKADFYLLVRTLLVTNKIDLPIEVYPVTNGQYYIADGVHRAMAAYLAGMQSVDAVIYSDSRPSGIMVPLASVVIP
jgi:hypothetical protein